MERTEEKTEEPSSGVVNGQKQMGRSPYVCSNKHDARKCLFIRLTQPEKSTLSILWNTAIGFLMLKEKAREKRHF
jgi:hypothetical protein